MAAVCNVGDYAKSTKLLASTTLRTILGTKNLSEILSDRETIAEDILSNLDRATDPWGVKVMIFFFVELSMSLPYLENALIFILTFVTALEYSTIAPLCFYLRCPKY